MPEQTCTCNLCGFKATSSGESVTTARVRAGLAVDAHQKAEHPSLFGRQNEGPAGSGFTSAQPNETPPGRSVVRSGDIEANRTADAPSRQSDV